MFLCFFLVALDTHLDLSDGVPRAARNDPAISLGWPSLRRDTTEPRNGMIVRMLGYMMDGYQFVHNGASARMFILMPEAGHFLHPAHRIPDEMVEIWPTQPVIFGDRELVWVCGSFERVADPAEDHALFALREATVTPASVRDVAGWFGLQVRSRPNPVFRLP